MTKIEYDVRLMTIAERIRQLQSELLVLEDLTPSHAKKNCVRLATIHLEKAAEELEPQEPLDLEALLRLSIHQVQQQKRETARMHASILQASVDGTVREQRMCEVVGSETGPEAEKAHAANVSPFLNR